MSKKLDVHISMLMVQENLKGHDFALCKGNEYWAGIVREDTHNLTKLQVLSPFVEFLVINLIKIESPGFRKECFEPFLKKNWF